MVLVGPGATNVGVDVAGTVCVLFMGTSVGTGETTVTVGTDVANGTTGREAAVGPPAQATMHNPMPRSNMVRRKRNKRLLFRKNQMFVIAAITRS